MKKIQFTSGCPNNCQYCYEPKEMKYFNPELPKAKEDVQIMDMNFLANPKHIEILRSLPKARYEFVCGIDYRFLTQEAANLMKEKGFHTIRWAWDYQFSLQKIHQKTWQIFKKAGFKNEDLSVFMLVNWKTPFIECCKKLDLLKIWNIKVNDCCWDGGYKIAKAKYWTYEEIRRFRAMCRKHNQMVLFKIDPELKSKSYYKSSKNKNLEEFSKGDYSK